MTDSIALETATIAGGCFWCIEAAFRQIDGVVKVVSGYTGGTTSNPSYEQVCTGATGHAEAVQVTFDPEKISYREILEIFFSIHDPTTPDRQGADIGSQYRSAIFYHSEQQKSTAEDLIRELDRSHRWQNPIVTAVSPLGKFYPAEEYHQNYFTNHSKQPYCRVVISPKLNGLRRQWARRIKKSQT